MRFQVEEGTESLTVGGHRYTVEDGYIECENHEHHGQLKQLGCVREDEIVAVIEQVVAAEPPALPEGYDEAAFRALIEEAEDQKVAIEQLHKDLAERDATVKNLTEALSTATVVEDELRNRVQELTGLLETATDRLQSATEDASGAVNGATGGESSYGTAEATETAPPATDKAKAK